MYTLSFILSVKHGMARCDECRRLCFFTIKPVAVLLKREKKVIILIDAAYDVE